MGALPHAKLDSEIIDVHDVDGFDCGKPVSDAAESSYIDCHHLGA